MATDPGMLKSWYEDFTKAQGAPAVPTAPATAQQPAGMLAMGQQSPQAAQATPTQWTPGANSFVSNQVNKLTAAGSPLIDQSTTMAKQQVAERGLLNSTMGITAGLDAAYRTALPIAQQDAKTDATAGQFNTEAANRAAEFNAGESNSLMKQALSEGGQERRLALTERGQGTRQGTEIDARTREAANLASTVAARDRTAIQADRDAAAALAGNTTARDKAAQDAAIAAAAALGGTNAAAAATAAAVLSKRDETLAAVNKAATLFSANVGLELADVNRKNQALLNKSYNAVNAQAAYGASLNSIALSTLDRTAKDTAAANAQKVYTNALALISSVDNVADLSSLVDFSGLQKQPVPLVFPQGPQVPQGPPAPSAPQLPQPQRQFNNGNFIDPSVGGGP